MQVIEEKWVITYISEQTGNRNFIGRSGYCSMPTFSTTLHAENEFSSENLAQAYLDFIDKNDLFGHVHGAPCRDGISIRKIVKTLE